MDMEEDIDLCFVGHLKTETKHFPHRIEFLNKVNEKLKGKYKFIITSGPYVELFNRAKIILNHCIHDDLNFRVFEAMGCGGMLLTPDTGGVSDLFEDRKHLVLYEKENADMVAELVEYYISHEEERNQICSHGREEVLRNNTFKNRAVRLIEILRENDYQGFLKKTTIDRSMKCITYAKVFIKLAPKKDANKWYEIAEELLEKSHSLDKENKDAYFLLGMVYFLQGKLKEAREWISEYIRAGGNNEMAMLALGVFSYYEGDFLMSSSYWGTILCRDWLKKWESSNDPHIYELVWMLFKDFIVDFIERIKNK